MTPIFAVPAGVIVGLFSVNVASVYLHRGLTHRAIQFSPAGDVILHMWTWLFTGVRPHEWVHVHQVHHRHADTPADPHSPRVRGTVTVFICNALLYRRCVRDSGALTTRSATVREAHRHRRLLNSTIVGPIAGSVALAWFTSIGFSVLFFGAHTTTYLAAMGFVNAIGHAVGSAPFPNTARNTSNLAAVLLTAGESLHNNHHAHPTRARLAFAPGERDPGYALIRVLTRIGLITSETHRDPVQLAAGSDDDARVHL